MFFSVMHTERKTFSTTMFSSNRCNADSNVKLWSLGDTDPSMRPLTQRAEWAAPVKDGPLEFTFEGQGSSAGSASCCSLLDSQDDLDFLDDLGIKFKTLAEICSLPENPSPLTS